MPDTKKQHELDAAEESGEFEPVAERYESILGSFHSTAEKKMSKAIDTTQNDLSRMRAAGATQEDRSVTMKEANKVAEKGRIAIRNVRRDLMQKIGRLADYERDISQGDKERMNKDIQQVTDSFIEQIDNVVQQRVDKLHSVSDQ